VPFNRLCLRRTCSQVARLRVSVLSLTAGGLSPALLLRSCFRYFSLSLQSALHVSIALLVHHRSGRVYRCSLRDTPEIQTTLQSSPTQEEAAKDGKSPRTSTEEREIPLRVFHDSFGPPERFFKLVSCRNLSAA